MDSQTENIELVSEAVDQALPQAREFVRLLNTIEEKQDVLAQLTEQLRVASDEAIRLRTALDAAADTATRLPGSDELADAASAAGDLNARLSEAAEA